MEKAPYQKLLTKKHHIIGLALTGAFFVLMSVLLVPFTFSTDKTVALAQSCLTAVPITATFWFAYNMFMIVLIDQKRSK